jgi:broad specificity polyphosphatase/5'/3'-nucleotidase SurE
MATSSNPQWNEGIPTLTISIEYNLEKLKLLLDGNWAKLDEVTAKTLHEVGHAMLAPQQPDEAAAKINKPEWDPASEIAKLEWEQARLRYYIEALERRVTREQRQEASAEAYYEWSQHDPPASVQK